MGRVIRPDIAREEPLSSLPEVEQVGLHVTLSLALLRAKTAELHHDELLERLGAVEETSFPEALILVQATERVRCHQALWLYYACAESVMERWEMQFGGESSLIDELVTDRRRREVLIGARNVIFHALYIDEPRMEKFEKADDIEPWVNETLGEITEYTRQWFKSYSEAAAKSG